MTVETGGSGDGVEVVDGVAPNMIPHEPLPEAQVVQGLASLLKHSSDRVRRGTKRVKEGVFGGPIIVSPGSRKGIINIQHGETGTPIPTADFVAEIELERQGKRLTGLGKVIDKSSDAVFAGGLAIGAYGIVRRNPTIIAHGLGIAAAGLITKVENPARNVVETQIGHLEEALEDIEQIGTEAKQAPQK